VVAAVRPARPAGRGSSWEALAARKDDIAGWVKDGLTLVKIGELLERSGSLMPMIERHVHAGVPSSRCGAESVREAPGR
jgi:hypothetical protein